MDMLQENWQRIDYRLYVHLATHGAHITVILYCKYDTFKLCFCTTGVQAVLPCSIFSDTDSLSQTNNKGLHLSLNIFKCLSPLHSL